MHKFALPLVVLVLLSNSALSACDGASEPRDVCSGDGPSLEWGLDVPDDLTELAEGYRTEIEAACVVQAIEGDAEDGWAVDLMCSHLGSSVDFDQPYSLRVERTVPLPDPIFVSSEVSLRYSSWNSIDVGAGRTVSISTTETTLLGLYSEVAEGGVAGHCLNENDTYLAKATQWLESFEAWLEPAGCADSSLLRVARTQGTTTERAHPGELAEMGDVTALVSRASCIGRSDGSEAWNLSVALWRHQ